VELQQLRDLYGGPPTAFVAARDALAKELRAAGDREGATAVKQLRRHSPVQWVLNRVARANPDATSSFGDAAAQLRASQAAAIEGRQGGDVREAMSVLRLRTAELVTAAAALEPSVAAGDVTALLHELAGDERGTNQLVEGVLGSAALGEADPFEGLTPGDRTPRAPRTTASKPTGTVAERSRAVPAAAPVAERTTTDAAPAKPSAAAAKSAEREARNDAARRRAELREAEQAARRAARDERDARVRVDEAERALADARAGLADAVAERTAADETVERLRT
jgi:hypothetical protein